MSNNALGSRLARGLRFIWKRNIVRNRKQLLRGAIVGLTLTSLTFAVIAWGVDHLMSLNCRSKSDPKVYGVEFCIPPVAKPSAKKAEGPALCPRSVFDCPVPHGLGNETIHWQVRS